jgi:hypothetical protein
MLLIGRSSGVSGSTELADPDVCEDERLLPD